MSTNPRIYLDFNAGAPLLGGARAAMVEAMAVTGNPSSVHAEGRAARDLVERARNHVAILAGRPREQVIFTSGGTEANRLGIARLAAAAARRGLPRTVASAGTDHPSLAGAIADLVAHGWEHRPAGADATLVAVTLVNHELGTIAAVPSVASGTLVHIDAVQAAGKLPLSDLRADSISLSAHKLGGPQGAGALVTSLDDDASLDAPHGTRALDDDASLGGPQRTGASNTSLDAPDLGHQERGRRPGTENTVGIAGFGAAASAVDLAIWPAVAALGARLEAGLLALGARINGATAPRTGGTINAAFPNIRGESLVIALDLAGISASTGAACTSGSIKPSPVLLALGQSPDQAREAVRFSLGRSTTAAEIDAVLAALPPLLARARR